MSDYYDLTDMYKNKFKKTRLIFPMAYLKEMMRGVFQFFLPHNILNNVKSSPMTIYNRLFGSSGRRQIYNVLVLVADLETNLGAACIELLNNEAPDLMKRFNYRPHFPFIDDNLFLDDFTNDFYPNDTLFNNHMGDNICNDIHDESLILDANIMSDDQFEIMINPEYLLQTSITSDSSTTNLNNIRPTISFNRIEYNSRDSSDTVDISQVDISSFETSSFTEASTSDISYEWGDKENKYSDDVSDDEESEFESEYDPKSLPKPIKREINQLRMIGVPYDYQQITQSSHEDFKVLRSNPKLNQSQIASMVNARRRYINRRAATRCRSQKVQQKDQLKIELKRLQEQLSRTKVTLTRAYQERNHIKDSFRELQQGLLSRLEGADGRALSPRAWTTEFVEGRRLVLREAVVS